MKEVLVVGGTSDIARALIKKLLLNHYKVLATMRNPESAKIIQDDLKIQTRACSLNFTPLDVCQPESFNQFCDVVSNQLPNLSGVFFATGHMEKEDVYDQSMDAVQQTFDVNVVSLIILIQKLHPLLKDPDLKFISVISSVAGDRGRESNKTYGASKAALTAYLEGLRQSLHSHSILIQTVKPGPVDTKMTQSMDGLPFLTTPDKVADDILKGINHKKDVIYTPWIWYIIMGIIRAIPSCLFKRLKL